MTSSKHPVSLNIHQALTEHAPLLVYAPNATRPFYDGLHLLRRVARHQLVYVVRLQQGYIDRVLGPATPTELTERRLVPGVTAYAAAFQVGGQPRLLLVSRNALAVESAPTPPPSLAPTPRHGRPKPRRRGHDRQP